MSLQLSWVIRSARTDGVVSLRSGRDFRSPRERWRWEIWEKRRQYVRANPRLLRGMDDNYTVCGYATIVQMET